MGYVSTSMGDCLSSRPGNGMYLTDNLLLSPDFHKNSSVSGGFDGSHVSTKRFIINLVYHLTTVLHLSGTIVGDFKIILILIYMPRLSQ